MSWLIFSVMGRTLSAVIRRHLRRRLAEALRDTPVVLLVGARQVGKTTLAKSVGDERQAGYLTMDDASVLAAATADPWGFISERQGPVVLDEVQRAPALFPAIKQAVDMNRSPGRFLLTGSANVLALPKVSESLVGRMEVLTLRPFSQGELRGVREGFLDGLFQRRLPPFQAKGDYDVVGSALKGGYPEAEGRSSPRRAAWFDAYLQTLLARDIRELANVEGLSTLPLLLELLSHRAASLVNYAAISRDAGIAQTTLKRYIALFEHTYLVHLVPAWAKKPSKRLVKSPKLHFVDTGLLCRLAGWTRATLRDDRRSLGVLQENFVLAELLKQSGWANERYGLYHFRTSSGREVDLVLESEDRRIVGIEVKSGRTVTEGDFRGLEALRQTAGGRFHHGIVLYGGEERLPFGSRLHALPMSALWDLNSADEAS